MEDFDEICMGTWQVIANPGEILRTWCMFKPATAAHQADHGRFVPAEAGSNSGVWSWERVRIEDFDEIYLDIWQMMANYGEIW